MKFIYLILVATVLASLALGHQDLAAKIQKAATTYRPVDTDRMVTTKKAVLVEALRATDAWLKANPENRKAWRAFLEWDALEAEVAAAEPSLEHLKILLNQWRKDNVGLDDPRFVACQRALRDFIRAEELSRLDGIERIFRQRMEILAGKVATHHATIEPEEALAIGKYLGWIDYLGQAPEVTNAVRSRLSHPNLIVKVSNRLVAYAVAGQTVNNVQTTSATIAGVQTSGTAYTTGVISVSPVPGPKDEAAMEVRLDAEIKAPSNVGYAGRRGRIEIHSASNAKGVVTKRIYIGENGIKQGTSQVRVNSQSVVHGISAPFRFVERIAWRRSSRMQGQANAEASAITGQRLVAEFDKNVSEQLTKMNQDFIQKFRRTLEFQGTYPKEMHFSSNKDALVMVAKEANDDQLGAPTAPPALAATHDLSSAVHESFVGNFMEPYLGNRPEWDTGWYNIHKQLTMEEPAPLRVHDNAPRWYVWATEHAPTTVKFRDGKMYWRFRGKEIYRKAKDQPEEKVTRPVEMLATYEPVIQGKKVVGIRHGDVEVTYTDGRPVEGLDAALSKMLKVKMSAFFPPTMDLGGLTIPKGSAWEKFEKLEVTELKTENGWLVIGYVLGK